MNLATFALTLGASLRLTRLAVADTITDRFRAALAGRYRRALADLEAHRHALTVPAPPDLHEMVAARITSTGRRAAAWLFLVELFECPWCIGFWIALSLTAVALSPVHAHAWLWTLPTTALSVSWLLAAVYTGLVTVEEFEPRKHSS